MSQCPLVALISSQNVHSQCNSRGFKSISHILYPMDTHDVSFREPVGNQPFPCAVRLDIRDISNDGHLLSLSVLPYVLTQALKSSENVHDAINLFREVLQRWAEPSEHESFGAYLACIFVVSTADENPMGELSRLIQNQQTLHTSSSTLLIPPYCCSPKWATAHAKTPKHYILLHDTTSSVGNDSTRRDEVFQQMCSTYGNDNCQIMQFDSTSECSSRLAHNWHEIDVCNDVLSRGLEDAMKHAAESNSSSPANGSFITTPSSPSSVSTISSTLPVSSISPNVSRSNTTTLFWKNSTKMLSDEEYKLCETILDKFVKNCLLPHVEKEMKVLHELVGTRRGLIGKSITSGMKKWFTTGSSQNNLAVPASYSWDSPEMQLRRLADLSYVFGNYSFAYQQYRVLKKDLEADQAMVAHAVASEMCAVALNKSQQGLNAKQFPLHYLESAVTNLLNHSTKYLYIIRCAFHASDVLSSLECYKEAANTLSRLTSIDGDYLVGVVQAYAAAKFEKCGMLRKASFYRVLAANRLSNANIPNIAFDCYRLALPEFDEKHWGVLDEHLSVKLLAEGEKAGLMNSTMAIECVRRLVAVCPKLTPTLQADRLRKIVHVLDAYASQKDTVLIDIPCIDLNGIKVIYGERPLWNEIDDNENKQITSDEWIVIERAAHYSLFGSSTPFRGMQLVSDSHSDNLRTRETPVGERYRVLIDLRNPLGVPINLQNVRLSVEEGDKSSNEAGVDIGSVEILKLDADETKTIELYVLPRSGCKKFKVDGLLYRLALEEPNIGVEVKIPLEVRGKRLNKTQQQQKSKMYAIDDRLSANVSQNSWPLVEFRVLKTPSKYAYCDQAMRYLVEIENIGNQDVDSMCLATNGYDRVAAGIVENGDVKTNAKLKMAANNNQISTFLFDDGKENENKPFLRVGEKKRIFFDVRASDEPTSSSSVAQKSTSTVIMIGYSGSNGSMREWRKVLDVERRRLLAVEANMLDEESGAFSLNIRNCVSVSQAALSRVEILRIRCAQNEQNVVKDSANTLPFGLEVVSKRKMEIESEQSDTIVARLTRSTSDVWLSSDSQESSVPKWPCPAIIESYDDTEKKIARKIGVLWKASIVNNEGHVSSLIGETFVDDPFEKESSTHTGIDGNNDSLRVSCYAEKMVSHNFSENRICELPIRIKLRNSDLKQRTADVSIRYVTKIRDAVDGIHLVPPESRQQMWVDRPIRRTTIAGNEQKEITMKIRVSHASVYDIGGNNLVVDAVFDGSTERISFKVPSVLSVVKAV